MEKYRNTPVSRPTLVYGKDVSDLSDGAIIAQIKACQEAQKALSELNVESVSIRIQQSQYDQAIDALVAEMDSRVPATEFAEVQEGRPVGE